MAERQIAKRRPGDQQTKRPLAAPRKPLNRTLRTEIVNNRCLLWRRRDFSRVATPPPDPHPFRDRLRRLARVFREQWVPVWILVDMFIAVWVLADIVSRYSPFISTMARHVAEFMMTFAGTLL